MGTLSDGLSGLELEHYEFELTSVFVRPPSHVQPLISTCRRTLACLALTLDECKLQYYMLDSGTIEHQVI